MASSATTSFVESNQLVCAYCTGKTNDHRFRTLNDEQYALVCEFKQYGRQDYFCITCIVRIDAKLNRHKVKQQRKRPRHGTTNETEDPFDPEQMQARRRTRRDGRENQHPNVSQPTSSQDSSNRSAGSQRSAESAAAARPSLSHQQMPPPRRVATKSTAGRHRINPPPPNVLQRSPSQSARSHTNSLGSGPSSGQPVNSAESDSGMQPNYEMIPPGPNAPSRDPSLNHPTPHGTPQHSPRRTPQQSPHSSYLSVRGSDIATPPRSLDVPPRRSRNVTSSGSPGVSPPVPRPPGTRPQGALPGPSAPMPKNRHIRSQIPHPISPRRPGESASEHRERVQRAHREFYRGGSG